MGLFVKIRFVREKLSRSKVGLLFVLWFNWVGMVHHQYLDHEIPPFKALFSSLLFRNYLTFFDLVKNNI